MFVMNQTTSVRSLIKRVRAKKKIWARDCDFCKKSTKFLTLHIIFYMKKFFFPLETYIKSWRNYLGRQWKRFEQNRMGRCRDIRKKVNILPPSGFRWN
jgi:hypothetical protein